MMLKSIPILMVAFLSGSLALAEMPPLTVAVYDFTGSAEANSYGQNVTALVTADLTAETNLVMLERAELDKALSEQAFGVSGMVSSDAAAKIGQITGARVLVAGQVIKTGGDHLVIVADIIGTETGRLFAAKVEGAPDDLAELTSDLSRKIAQTIMAQTTNLVATAEESHAERLARIVKSIKGKNRPAVSVDVVWPNRRGHSSTAEAEFGAILLKAGFEVVDSNSDRRPDVEITGVDDASSGPRRGNLFSFRAVIDLKVQERRTGNIITFDHQESTATDIARAGADRAAQVNAVDALAARVLPLLANSPANSKE
ncbi:MAG TPA: CsgG/HfaB family protein [Candidatus Sulfopaludibacter sp.]|nr:CsgG/HfaB family protein [Candidatus Sulfopaludibacter sp.]